MHVLLERLLQRSLHDLLPLMLHTTQQCYDHVHEHSVHIQAGPPPFAATAISLHLLLVVQLGLQVKRREVAQLECAPYRTVQMF